MKLALSLIIPYLLCILVVFLFQRKMIYLPQVMSIGQQKQLAANSQMKLWPTEDNFLGLISDRDLPKNKGTIIVFHGNAGSANNRIYYLDALEDLGYRVILAEYPGYGARKGKPSEQSLLADANKTVSRAIKDYGSPLFLWGESLGTGVVSGVIQSQKFPVKGVALITPYDSLANVAHRHYWFFWAKWLILDQFNSIKNLQNFTGNTAIIMAGKDDIIPNQHTLNLYDSLPGTKKIWTFPEAGHNTLPFAPENLWWKEVMSFMDK
jgi:alpha-beta hydrolase superfamily lysophospholipase